MPDLESLNLFADVARHRSFSRAAELHEITQPAVSQRVALLEKAVGVKLVDRSVRPLRLTAAGRKMAEGAERIVRDVADLLAEVRSLGTPIDGGAGGTSGGGGGGGGPVLRVSAISSAGIDLLSRVEDALRGSDRPARLAVRYEQHGQAVDAVVSGTADVGIVSYPRESAAAPGVRLAARHLWDEPMAVVCPPGHALAREATVHARHVGAHGLLGFDARLPVGAAIDRYLASHGVRPDFKLRFDNLDTLRSAVLDTGHPAILPVRTVRRETQAGTLRAVNLTPALARPMGVVLPRGKPAHHLAPALEALLDTLQRFANGPDEQAPTPPLRNFAA